MQGPIPRAMSGALSIPGDELALCVVRAARGTATGFAFLQPDWIVTARHVVADQPPGEPVRLLFAGEIDVPARVAFQHPRVDLAVLELLEEGPCRSPFLPGDPASLSGPLLCVGYKPSLSHPDGGRYVSFATGVPRFERTNRQRDGREETLFMFAAPDGEPGHSGGPVLTPGGSVLAVVVDGIRIGGEYFIRATAAAALLEDGGWARSPARSAPATRR